MAEKDTQVSLIEGGSMEDPDEILRRITSLVQELADPHAPDFIDWGGSDR